MLHAEVERTIAKSGQENVSSMYHTLHLHVAVHLDITVPQEVRMEFPERVGIEVDTDLSGTGPVLAVSATNVHLASTQIIGQIVAKSVLLGRILKSQERQISVWTVGLEDMLRRRARQVHFLFLSLSLLLLITDLNTHTNIVCHECVAGRSSPRAGTSCSCRPAATCTDHDDFEIAKLGIRPLLGANCVASQADRCKCSVSLSVSLSLLINTHIQHTLQVQNDT
jgi:hypothetical protein